MDFCFNERCDGCSQLEGNKPFTGYLDYEDCGQHDVLFLSDSLNFDGEVAPFSDVELNFINRFVVPLLDGVSWTIKASVKCPSVKEKDMTTADIKICRQYLEGTIDEIKPKLVFACGNLALKMLAKRSGIGDKRGRTYDMESESGFPFKMIPIFHPFSVIIEPRLLFLFQMDIANAINKYIRMINSEIPLSYEIVREVKDFQKYDFLKNTKETIAVDVETTGLDFLVNKLTVVGIAYKKDGRYEQIVVPLHHFESPYNQMELKEVIDFLRDVMSNPNNKKVMHNSKFDLKYLLKEGIQCVNVWDTVTLAHLDNEDQPKSLKELVKKYFPEHVKRL